MSRSFNQPIPKFYYLHVMSIFNSGPAHFPIRRRKSSEIMNSKIISHCSFMIFFQLFLNLQCAKFLPHNLELVQLKNHIIYSKNHFPSLLIFDILMLNLLKPSQPRLCLIHSENVKCSSKTIPRYVYVCTV